MKILFLHLSDAHFTEDTRLREININAMVKALKEIDNFDECVIVFSGDIAYSGEVNQYKTAGKFMGILINQLKRVYSLDKKIYTLIVPGNHDNLVVGSKKEIEDLKDYYTSKVIDDKFYAELSQLNNFYDFAKRNSCFKEAKVVDVKRLIFDKFIIKVNLINTAPFSLLCKGNEDKGLHYLPQREIDRLDSKRQENYTISIIHHSPEWFSDETKRKLYDILYETSDLIFAGHEHFSLSETKIVNGRFNINVSNGLALYGTKTEHGFNTLILDTRQHTLAGNKFVYNGLIYKPEKNLKSVDIRFRNKHKFTQTEEFRKFLENDVDEREGENYLNYFVFPSLEIKNVNDELKNYIITTEEKFLELIDTKETISIEGGSRSGKTILAKYLCKMFLNEYIPIYLNNGSFAPKDNKKVIKYALIEQYGDDIDLDEYIQLNRKKKILIVDGYDLIKKERWKFFCEEYKEQFGHLILFCGIDWNLNIKERTLEELQENKILYMKICPFYYVKREQLIKKICSNSSSYDIQNVDEKARIINEDITDQIKYFQLNPDFIHQFVDYYLAFSYTKTQKETNVFSKVFEANITFRLRKNTSEENVSEIMIALDYIAHYIHFNKKYPLVMEDFIKVIREYEKAYDNKIRPMAVYKIAIKSNIIREVKGKEGIEFCDENLLAYFTAAHLNRKFNEGEGKEELKYILDNICFVPNGDIILFLSYITSNVQILNPIMTSLIKHMENWEELSIDADNVGYLSKVKNTIKITPPNEEEKSKIKEDKDYMEREIVEQYQKETESLYSYDESKINSFGNKISKSINYLDLVAKILPNFRSILKGNQKKEIVKILYTYPNKLLYFMLKDVDKNYSRIINDILDSAPKTRKGKIITEAMIAKELQNQSIAYILSIYNFIAQTASNNKTMMDLNKKEYFNYEINTNYRIQNILMEECTGNFHSMALKAEKLYKEAKFDIVKQMTTLIVRKYFLYHDIPITGVVQHTLDIFFKSNTREKKAIQLVQAKNRLVKK